MNWVRRIGLGGSGAGLGLIVLALAGTDACAQDLEPRAYTNTPPGVNFVLAGYGYSTGDVVVDPSFPLKDGHAQTNTMLLAYARSLRTSGAQRESSA